MAKLYKVLPLAEFEKLMGTTFETSINQTYEVDNILELLPSKLQEKASKILKILERSAKFKWKPSGEIVYENKVLPFSHINDLLYMATRITPVKNYDIVGMAEFVSAIKEVNVPMSLFSIGFRSFITDNKPSSSSAETNWISFRKKFK